ncbi:MAG: helix-turn-helix domain-containing protein, partial [Myxococcota bacterium]
MLRAARDCFAERGLAATTTREIARRAGVTQPLLHHYFGSKDALFDAVLEAALSDYEDAQTDQWSRSMD